MRYNSAAESQSDLDKRRISLSALPPLSNARAVGRSGWLSHIRKVLEMGRFSGLAFTTVALLTRILARLETHLADPSDLYYCYRLLLGRKPDPEAWKSGRALLRTKISRKDLVDGFYASSEFRQRFEAPPVFAETDHGFGIYVESNDRFISQTIIGHETYEPHVTAVLKRELREDHVFLDIGANMGWYTLLAANILRKGKVIAVEPMYSNAQLIYQSLIQNDFKNVFVFPYAATDRSTLLQLNFVRTNAYVTATSGASHAHRYVQGVKLDDILGQEPKIDIVKIDIEGHEPLALQGMQGLIRKHHPILVSEFHPKALREYSNCDPSSYLQSILDFGYRLAVIDSQGQELIFAETDAILEYWRSYNARSGMTDEFQLDIIARPLD
jgi:FkbM family methyltransferase